VDLVRRTRQLIDSFAASACAFGVAVAVLVHSPATLAGPKDSDGQAAVTEAFNEFVEAKYDKALSRLNAALITCRAKACEPGVRAQIYMAIGVIQGAGKKKMSDAKSAFEKALAEDPKVTLDKEWATKDLEQAFGEARQTITKPTRAPATKAQLSAVVTAQASFASKDFAGCMAELIADSEFAAGKLMLAKCEDGLGQLLEARNDAELAQKFASEEGNLVIENEAKEVIERLKVDTPTITLQIPSAWSEVEVKVDNVAVPADKLKGPIPHNPGQATIDVKGKRGKFPAAFKTTERMERGDQLTVNADQGGGNNSAVFQCMQAARTPADMQRCIDTGGKGRGFTLKTGVETMFYTDNFNTTVVSPAAFLSFENPTAGYSLGASFVVDVVSAASPDIVATASRRWNEVRYAGTLSGDVKIKTARVGINGALSIEPDYIARSVGAAISTDLHSKMITPTLAYNFGFDILGKVQTPLDVFRQDIYRHSIDAGVSFVIDASTVVVAGATAEFVLGDTSKPYRHIPMFASNVAQQIPAGATAELLGSFRLPFAPLEQLPTDRQRYALFGRGSKRFEKATIRGDERLYVDSWGQLASTTDARYYYDLNDNVRLGGHVRFNVQGPVSFWKRAYTSAPLATGGWSIPQFRTADRELGPLIGVTAGANFRVAFAQVFSLQLQAEGLYNQYLDHIYVFNRLGLFTAATLELEVD
jgi:tetratricopeptide (TPR) repeat protein